MRSSFFGEIFSWEKKVGRKRGGTNIWVYIEGFIIEHGGSEVDYLRKDK